MKRSKRLLMFAWLGIVAIPFSSARSDLIGGDFVFEAVAQPVDANSWYQGLHLGTASAFSNVGLVLLPGIGDDGTSGFEGPAWDFSSIDGNPLGFTEVATTSSFTWATGAATNDLFWRTHFLGDKEGQQFSLTVFVWDDLFNFQVAGAAWDGVAWNFSAAPTLTFEEFVEIGGIAGITAPAPSAAVLGMLGMALIGGIKRRFR